VDLITVIDGSTDSVKATFKIGSEARALAFHANGKLLYVAARKRTIQVGSRPHGVVYDPDTDRVYVTNRGSCNSTPGSVSVVDAEKGIVEATIPVGNVSPLSRPGS
jgi:YVTN family beta-propeller protein